MDGERGGLVGHLVEEAPLVADRRDFLARLRCVLGVHSIMWGIDCINFTRLSLLKSLKDS